MQIVLELPFDATQLITHLSYKTNKELSPSSRLEAINNCFGQRFWSLGCQFLSWVEWSRDGLSLGDCLKWQILTALEPLLSQEVASHHQRKLLYAPHTEIEICVWGKLVNPAR